MPYAFKYHETCKLIVFISIGFGGQMCVKFTVKNIVFVSEYCYIYIRETGYWPRVAAVRILPPPFSSFFWRKSSLSIFL